MNDIAPRNHLQEMISLGQKQAKSLGSELERQASLQEQAPFIIFEDKIISFGEFNRRANQYASHFRELGFKKGDVVALLMENRPEYLIAASGLSKLGIIVSLVNNGVRGDVLAHALNICQAGALIVGQELIEAYAEVNGKVNLESPAVFYMEGAVWSETARKAGFKHLNPLLDACTSENPAETGTVTSDDVIVYIYTSGTTGLPKATAVAQRRWLVLGHIAAMIGQMNPATSQYMVLPLYHNSGFDIGFSSAIVSGSSMALRRRFSARTFWEDIHKYNSSHFIYVGELCRYIYNQPPRDDDADNPLRFIMGNGMRGDLMEPFKKRFNLERLIEVYGATEGVGSFINMAEVPGMCGSMVLNGQRQGEIVRYDVENDEIVRDKDGYAVKCSVGETGLLLCTINELNRFAGYVNNPKATEAKLLRNVFRPGDEYFNSGDLLQLHENDYMSFVDRLGDTYRWKSENVSTNQVGDVLNAFGTFEDANVYGVEVPGSEGRCGMAALKLLEGKKFEPQGLAEYVRQHLPSYARPYFVRLRPEIDATNSFKQLKGKLKQEGFNPALVSDPLYFLDTGKSCYVPLTGEIYEEIVSQRKTF